VQSVWKSSERGSLKTRVRQIDHDPRIIRNRRKIVNPGVLTASLLIELQNRLKAEGANLWRIRIPTYLEPNQVIVVYPSAICIPGNSSGDLKQDIELIRSQLIKKKGN